MEISFKGKRALVTGAGRGIGRAVTLKLAEYGADVVAVSRTQEHLDTLKAECSNEGSIETVCVDLSDWSATQHALSRVVSANRPPIQLLVNNAGVVYLQKFGEITEDAFDQAFSINVKAILNVTQIVTAPLRSSSQHIGGSIVNVSSQSSQRALDQHMVYCASKAAVDQLTRNMAYELGPNQIRVNAVNPTVIMTDMGRAAWSDPAKANPMLARIPLRRFSEVSECVDAILYLLSDKASMVNGALLPVEGGFWVG